ncbi:MAG: hypothetical protein H7844_09470 [Nitrospirae bacterium YQR-1]
MADARQKQRFFLSKTLIKAFIIVFLLCVLTELIVSAATYTITIYKTGTGTGSVTSSSGTITWSGNTGTISFDNSTTSVYFTPAVTSGSVFGSWSGCSSVASSNNTCTVSIDSNKSITAKFNGVDVYTLTVYKTGIGKGTIADSAGNLSLSSDNATTDNISTSYQYNVNTNVYLTATPKSANYILSYWENCDSVYDNGTCAVTMSSNRNILARFSGVYNVTYTFPYVSAHASGVIYCIVSNFSQDNATTDGLAIMSAQDSATSQKYYYFQSNLALRKKRTTYLLFSSRAAALGDNLTTSDNATNVNYSSEISEDATYSVKLKFTSTGGPGISGISCKNILISCFQGTTLPKRNILGYTCEDDTTAGPGKKNILIGY